MYRIGDFQPGDSCLHRLDPRAKILAMVGLSLLILGAGGRGLILVSALFAGLVLLSRVSVRYIFQSLRPLWVFFAVLLGLHLFFTPGQALVAFLPPPIRPTWEGLHLGLTTVWAFGLLVGAAALLTATTAPLLMVAGLEGLLKPLRVIGVPAQELALMVSMALRFLPTLLQEAERCQEAQAARGGSGIRNGSLRDRMRGLHYLAVPLVLNALRRAEELALAMEARGYDGAQRTGLHRLRLAGRDYLALIVVAAVGGLALA